MKGRGKHLSAAKQQRHTVGAPSCGLGHEPISIPLKAPVLIARVKLSNRHLRGQVSKYIRTCG